MTKLVFLDTETTGLADECDIWEIGLIARTPRPSDVDDALGDMTEHVDTEYCWQLRPDMTTAEPTGLRIGRYYDRLHPALREYGPGCSQATVHPELTADPTYGHVRGARTVARTVAQLLDGATIVGAVPDFDARHLSRWLRANGQCGTWHYHLVDVETLAAGALRKPPPWNFDELLATYGLVYDEADRHTALGDSRMVRDLYDAVFASREA